MDHVCGIAGPGATRRHGRHSHAMLVCPRQTSDARLLSSDAAVVMDGGASTRFGGEARRVNRGVRTANYDGAVSFWRKLDDAINHQDRDVRWVHVHLRSVVRTIIRSVPFFEERLRQLCEGPFCTTRSPAVSATSWT